MSFLSYRGRLGRYVIKPITLDGSGVTTTVSLSSQPAGGSAEFWVVRVSGNLAFSLAGQVEQFQFALVDHLNERGDLGSWSVAPAVPGAPVLIPFTNDLHPDSHYLLDQYVIEHYVGASFREDLSFNVDEFVFDSIIPRYKHVNEHICLAVYIRLSDTSRFWYPVGRAVTTGTSSLSHDLLVSAFNGYMEERGAGSLTDIPRSTTSASVSSVSHRDPMALLPDDAMLRGDISFAGVSNRFEDFTHALLVEFPDNQRLTQNSYNLYYVK